MSRCGGIGSFNIIRRIKEEELLAECKIFNFLDYKPSHNWYNSHVFSLGNEHWRLAVWPKWTNVRKELVTQTVGLYLGRRDEGPPKTFWVSLGIKTEEGVVMEKETEMEFSGYSGWLLDDFCSSFYLSQHRNRLLPNNVLTITCVIKTSKAARRGENMDTDVLYKPQSAILDPLTAEPVTPTEDQSSNKRGGEKLLEDFGKLLESGENSDVIVQVGDKTFKVHKVILSARCAVLSKMFLHETVEKASNKITLEDCEPDIFEDFLQYLYTGSVLSLTDKNVFGLYCIADKYLVDDLKQQCMEHIQVTLSVQTFCSAVKLALIHGEKGLLQQAIDFSIKNIPRIIITTEWQSFIREYPTEANEILIKCLRPQS